jgi:hypothetical protein
MSNSKLREFLRSFEAEVLIPEDVSSDAERRGEVRHSAQQYVALKFRSRRLICDLADLSETGAKVSVGDGIVPNVGDDVSLTMFDGTVIEGRILWLRDKHMGVEFSNPVPDVGERLDLENLGRDYYGKAVTLQKSTRRF